MQVAFLKVCIEEEHRRRWVVEKGRLKKERGGGYAQAVISRMFEQWPEMVGLLRSDISNKKAELFKGVFGGMAGGVEGGPRVPVFQPQSRTPAVESLLIIGFADTNGKCPHEVEAAAAEAAEARAAAAAAAVEAAALQGIPDASAGWAELAAFMHDVGTDLDARRLDKWQASGLRAKAVDGLCPSWKMGKNQEQARTVHNFHIKFRRFVF